MSPASEMHQKLQLNRNLFKLQRLISKIGQRILEKMTMNTKIKKESRVTTTGVGRTASWKAIKGTVTKRRGESVFVNWDGTHFEDEMHLGEVKLI